MSAVSITIHADKPSCFFEVGDIRYSASTDGYESVTVVSKTRGDLVEGQMEIYLPPLPSPMWGVSIARQRAIEGQIILDIALTRRDGAFSMVVIQPVITGILYGDCAVNANTEDYSKVKPRK